MPPTNPVTIATNFTGTGNTNEAQRSGRNDVGAITVTTTVGATPTITFTIQGSMEGVNWYAIPYALTTAPETSATAAITITTATTNTYILRTAQPWNRVRLNVTANTNVTITSAVAWV